MMNGVILTAAITLLGQTPAQPTRWVHRAPAQQRYYYTNQTTCPRQAVQQPAQAYYQQPAQAYYQQPAQQVAYSTPTYNYQQTTTTTPTVYQQTTQVQYYGSDPHGFMAWLNSTRASYGLGAVGYDSNLEAWAHQNNAQQAARGLGHFVMGPARRQNAAWSGSMPSTMWMNSPGHRAALLDPTITRIGIAFNGTYWTFNAS